MQDHANKAQPDDAEGYSGIVSVNSRGAVTGTFTTKTILALIALAVLIMACAMSYYRMRHARHLEEAEKARIAAEAGKPVETGRHRVFNADAPPHPVSATSSDSDHASVGQPACSGESDVLPLIGTDGKPLLSPSGAPMKVCSDGRIAGATGTNLPSRRPGTTISSSPPNARNSPANVPARPGRFGGDVLLRSYPAKTVTAAGAASGPPLPSDLPAITAQSPTDELSPYTQGLDADRGHQNVGGRSAAGWDKDRTSVADEHRPVKATFLGNRDMILPEGRTIDCNLSVRIVSEVSGKATCVLSSDVYSDNGKVVLAERGSTAVGEYVAAMAQGQRRLFILWSRLQTPNGVIVNLNSAASDALGTSGLPGDVDNRWRERIGAAVLLSLVEDGVGYATAKASAGNGGGGAQGVAIFQNTTQNGKHLAERILDSTINIKPTIYKHQGDRASIFVSRDLDFGSVYELRKK